MASAIKPVVLVATDDPVALAGLLVETAIVVALCGLEIVLVSVTFAQVKVFVTVKVVSYEDVMVIVVSPPQDAPDGGSARAVGASSKATAVVKMAERRIVAA